MLPDEDLATDEAETTETETGTQDAGTAKSVDDIAYEKGWRPLAQLKKLHPDFDESKFVDAAEFIRRGEENWPMVKAALRKAERENAENKALLRDLVKNQKTQQEAAVKRAIDALKADKKAAVAEGDVARVEKIDEQIDTLKANGHDKGEADSDSGRQRQEAPAAMPTEYTAWAKQNPWFFTDAVLKAEAVAALDIINVDPNTADLSEADKLKAVTKRVRNLYPEKFPAPKRPAANAVEGGNGGSTRQSGKKGWADLPQEAKDICDRLIRAKAIKDRDSYVKEYAW